MNGSTKDNISTAINTAMALAMVSGFIWVGTVDADVETLKKEADKVEQITSTVQAMAIEQATMKVRQEIAQRDIKVISTNVDKILEKLDEIEDRE